MNTLNRLNGVISLNFGEYFLRLGDKYNVLKYINKNLFIDI